MQASTIDEVIALLNEIIHSCSQQGSRSGYFACLYQGMTLAVKEGVRQGIFDDGPRMEALDVLFANRYLDAYTAYTAKQPTTSSWQAAFDAAATDQYTVIQHLLLGINAHINLDLGIAAAQVSEGKDISKLLNDYNKINDIIGNLSNTVQSNLEKVWFPMRFLNKIDNKDEDAVINFCICIARDAAWNNATTLASLPAGQWEQQISRTDQGIAALAGKITSPGTFMNLLLKWIRLSESSKVADNMRALSLSV